MKFPANSPVRRKGRAVGISLVTAVLALLALLFHEKKGPVPPPPETPRPASSGTKPLLKPAGMASLRVERIVDGDTIVVEGGLKVRYIGVDTPETVHPNKPVAQFGKEASAANRRLVQGKTVMLEYDVERTDKYGRTLAYVWADDVFVNAWLVENGYAKAGTYPPNVKYADLFRELQRKAREEGRGLWGKP